jgi:redox-sensitive bicupin YhaK (pirin superfamily)
MVLQFVASCQLSAKRWSVLSFSLTTAKGNVQINERHLDEKELAVGSKGQDLIISAASTSRLVVIGGEPFIEPREMFWNFVSSSKARLEQAKEDWRLGRFAKIPGDDFEFTPLPK